MTIDMNDDKIVILLTSFPDQTNNKTQGIILMKNL